MEYVIGIGIIIIIATLYVSFKRKETHAYDLDASAKKSIIRHQKKGTLKPSTVNKEVKDFSRPQENILVIPDRPPVEENTSVDSTTSEGEVKVESVSIEVSKESDQPSDDYDSLPQSQDDVSDNATINVEQPSDVKVEEAFDGTEVVSTLRFDLDVRDVKEEIDYEKGMIIKILSRRRMNEHGRVEEIHTPIEIVECPRSRKKHKVDTDVKALVGLSGSSSYDTWVLAIAVRGVIEHLEQYGVETKHAFQLKIPGYLIKHFDN